MATQTPYTLHFSRDVFDDSGDLADVETVTSHCFNIDGAAARLAEQEAEGFGFESATYERPDGHRVNADVQVLRAAVLRLIREGAKNAAHAAAALELAKSAQSTSERALELARPGPWRVWDPERSAKLQEEARADKRGDGEATAAGCECVVRGPCCTPRAELAEQLARIRAFEADDCGGADDL